MAYKNKVIRNPITGQDLKFLQTAKDTNGKLLEMEATYNAFSKEPPAHYHPYQTEDFTVASGHLTVRIKGEVKVLKQGDTLHIPKYMVHAMWNASDEVTVVNWKVQPAMDTEQLLETAFGLVVDGKTNAEGTPTIFQAALMANKFSNVFRLTSPVFGIQKVAFALLTPFSLLFGYKPMYEEYID